MIYILVLIACLSLIFKCDFSKKISGKNSLMILLLFVALMAGFRYMIGADTENYYDLYKQLPTLSGLGSDTSAWSRYQPGFVLLVSFVKTWFGYFFVLQLLEALFLNITIYFFITKHTKYFFTTLLLYLLLNYLEYNTEIQRESIAVGLGLISYMCYERKKYIIFFVFSLLAFEFHISAIVLLLYPIVDRIRFSYVSCFIILFLISFVLPSIFLNIPDLLGLLSTFMNFDGWNVNQYLSQELQDDWNLNFFIIHITRYLILPFVIILYNERRNKTNMLGFVYIWCALNFLNMYSYGFYRFANYFAPFVWLYYSQFVINFVKQHMYPLRVFIITGFSLLLLYLYRSDLLNKDGGFLSESKYMYERYIPYKSIFSEKVY